MSTLPLKFGPLADSEALYHEILRIIDDLAAVEGKGVFADKIGVSDNFLSNALKDRNRCHLKARELVAIIFALDPDKRILQRLAEAHGKTLYDERPLTPEEKLARLESRLRSKFGELGEEAMREAYRDG